MLLSCYLPQKPQEKNKRILQTSISIKASYSKYILQILKFACMAKPKPHALVFFNPPPENAVVICVWFSIVDIVAVLTGSDNPRRYWSDLKQGQEYATLTDLISKTWSGMTTGEYKKFKELKKENLRDNMTNMELVLNMLAEVSATEISIEKQPDGFLKSAAVAREGAEVAKIARGELEERVGNKVISLLNAKSAGRLTELESGDK